MPSTSTVKSSPSASTNLFVLELGGSQVGFLQSADFPSGTEIKARFSTGMNKAFYDWVGQCAAGTRLGKSGSVGTVNYQNREIVRVAWKTGHITHINFPALDAASKNACTVGITLGIQGGGNDAPRSVTPHNVRRPTFLSSNFRVSIDGVDCTRVSKIDAFSLLSSGKQSLTLTVLEAHAGDFRKWLATPKAKTGSIDCLSPDLRTSIFHIAFTNLTITKIDPAYSVGNHTATVKLQFAGPKFSAPGA
jgi:hypothetical protein